MAIQSGQKAPNLVQRFVVSKMDRLQKFCANLTAKIMKKAKNNENVMFKGT